MFYQYLLIKNFQETLMMILIVAVDDYSKFDFHNHYLTDEQKSTWDFIRKKWTGVNRKLLNKKAVPKKLTKFSIDLFRNDRFENIFTILSIRTGTRNHISINLFIWYKNFGSYCLRCMLKNMIKRTFIGHWIILFIILCNAKKWEHILLPSLTMKSNNVNSFYDEKNDLIPVSISIYFSFYNSALWRNEIQENIIDSRYSLSTVKRVNRNLNIQPFSFFMWHTL